MPPKRSKKPAINKLCNAVDSGNVQEVESLLAKGIDVNEHRFDGHTPLHLASKKTNTDILDRLLAAGADVNARRATPDGATSLYYAAESGKLPNVERLIAAGADVNKGLLTTNATPLHIVIDNCPHSYPNDYIPIVKRLLEAGANPNAINGSGRTPLYYVVGKRREYTASLHQVKKQLVNILIDAGANVNITDKYGNTALHEASSMPESDIHILDSLIAAGANVNAEDRIFKDTPLHIAVFNHGLNTVKKLIAAGANLNVINNAGYTPLTMSFVVDNYQIVKTLVEAGADVNETTNGTSPLYSAINKGIKVSILDILLEAGADVNVGNTQTGETPLYLTAKQNRVILLERLIQAGADIQKARTDTGETPLHAAAKEGHEEIIQKLLKAGADKTIVDKSGNRPTDVAKTQEIFKLLMSDAPTGPTLKWQGWTRGDAGKLDGVFGDDEIAKNFALCPVCMKYVERSEACMYMSHNCSKEKGYYHAELYAKYKNSDGIINWCTICGRICKGHNHFTLSLAQGPVPSILRGQDPFAKSCEGEGGGGIPEKILRFRRLREYARDLQKEVGKMEWWEAMDKLCEEMWNAPLTPSRALNAMLETKRYNIPNTNFPLTLPPVENAPNVPYAGEAPIVHETETEEYTNAMYMDDTNILQFRHKKANGEWNRHEGPGQQISRVGFVEWLKQMVGNPTVEGFGKCWQFATRNQQQRLSEAQKALVCDAVLHPEEVRAALDMEDAEQARLAEGYRKAFNAAFDPRRMRRWL